CGCKRYRSKRENTGKQDDSKFVHRHACSSSMFQSLCRSANSVPCKCCERLDQQELGVSKTRPQTQAGRGFPGSVNCSVDAFESRGTRVKRPCEAEVNPMRTKALIADTLVLALVVGTMPSGIYSAATRAFNPPESDFLAAEGNLHPLAGAV